MRVKILKPIYGFGYFEGEEVEVSNEEGAKWCEAKQATPIKGAAIEDTESKIKAEKSVTRKKKK